LLRDGFALTVTGANPSLASPARGSLEVSLAGHVPEETLERTVLHIIESLSGLGVCTVTWWTESLLWPSRADGS